MSKRSVLPARRDGGGRRNEKVDTLVPSARNTHSHRRFVCVFAPNHSRASFPAQARGRLVPQNSET
eukprot:1013077-Prymnesium_polylepis.1